MICGEEEADKEAGRGENSDKIMNGALLLDFCSLGATITQDGTLSSNT